MGVRLVGVASREKLLALLLLPLLLLALLARAVAGILGLTSNTDTVLERLRSALVCLALLAPLFLQLHGFALLGRLVTTERRESFRRDDGSAFVIRELLFMSILVSTLLAVAPVEKLRLGVVESLALNTWYLECLSFLEALGTLRRLRLALEVG